MSRDRSTVHKLLSRKNGMEEHLRKEHKGEIAAENEYTEIDQEGPILSDDNYSEGSSTDSEWVDYHEPELY